MVRHGFGRWAALGVLAVALLGTERSAWGQAADGPFPKFRDGVVAPPAAAIQGAPFDTGAFFPTIPLGENAAPLYLDALFEFGTEVSGCFPEGPDRDDRIKEVRARDARFYKVFNAVETDRASVSDAAIDDVMAEFREGFRKLAEAQKRPRCVFQTGVGVNSLLPHAQAARMVARAAVLNVRRDVERGEIDAAIGDVKIVLRLTRDLQRRGYVITQLVAVAMLHMVGRQMVPPILDAPGLTPGQCDALLAALREYRAEAVDAFTEAVMAEYASSRVSLYELYKAPQELAKTLSGDAADGVVKRLNQQQQQLPAILAREGGGEPKPREAVADDADAKVARTAETDFDKMLGRLNAFYKTILDLKGRPRFAQSERVPPAELYLVGDDPLTQSAREIQPGNLANFVGIVGRGEAGVRGSECLAALRRWQITHHGATPPDLAIAFKEAGRRAVPLDPFNDQPFRMATVDGQPVVYSVGKDGNDDHGRLDSDNDRDPGDLLFTLNPPGETAAR